MSNSADDKSICLPKDVVILNALAMGVAIQSLAKITEEPIEAWKHYVGEKAQEQQRELSAKQIAEIIEKLKSF